MKPSGTAYKAYARRARWLSENGYTSYEDYLRSDLWKGIKASVLAAKPRCETCNGPSQVVHHAAYSNGSMTSASHRALVALCNECHRFIELTSTGEKRVPPAVTVALACRLTALGLTDRAKEVVNVAGRKYVRNWYAHDWNLADKVSDDQVAARKRQFKKFKHRRRQQGRPCH